MLVRLGEPGIGKSTLIEEATVRAVGTTVLQAVGMQAESELPYAGLHQLIGPLLPRLADIPRPQQLALERAFGMADGPLGNPFLVALGTLTLLTESAGTDGLLCVVDDAHWLDDASLGALAGVARRLHSDGVVLLITARPSRGSPRSMACRAWSSSRSRTRTRTDCWTRWHRIRSRTPFANVWSSRPPGTRSRSWSSRPHSPLSRGPVRSSYPRSCERDAASNAGSWTASEHWATTPANSSCCSPPTTRDHWRRSDARRSSWSSTSGTSTCSRPKISSSSTAAPSGSGIP